MDTVPRPCVVRPPLRTHAVFVLAISRFLPPIDAKEAVNTSEGRVSVPICCSHAKKPIP